MDRRHIRVSGNHTVTIEIGDSEGRTLFGPVSPVSVDYNWTPAEFGDAFGDLTAVFVEGRTQLFDLMNSAPPLMRQRIVLAGPTESVSFDGAVMTSITSSMGHEFGETVWAEVSWRLNLNSGVNVVRDSTFRRSNPKNLIELADWHSHGF